MINTGDAVVHPAHGAGILCEIKEMTIGDNTRKYYYVELISGGTLMIPMEQAGETGLRAVTDDVNTIESILSEQPQTLTDNFRQRQALMSKLISSGNVEQVAQALRDLAWRNHCARLSTGDMRLMSRAKEFLTSIMAAVKPNLDLESAAQRLDNLIKQNFQAREMEVTGS